MNDDDARELIRRLFPEHADEVPTDQRPSGNFSPLEGNNPPASGDNSMREFVRDLFAINPND